MLVKILHEASRRLARNEDSYGNLVFTGKQRSGCGRSVREPEASHVLALTLQERSLPFGLEVPTTERYAFTTTRPDSANIDLAISPFEMQVNIELKTGQPGVSRIEKDFRKMISEDARGCAFYHILENANSRTLASLIPKYGESFRLAFERTEMGVRRPKWFVHYLLIRRKRETRWRTWGNILEVHPRDFVPFHYSKAEFAEFD